MTPDGSRRDPIAGFRHAGWWRERRARRQSEGGQLTPMVIGFVLITLLMVTVLANASKAFLYHRSLASWADGAALVAAQSVAAEQIYAGELGGILPLSPGGAIDEVSAYAMRHDLADQFSDFAVASVDVDPSSGTVRVTLSARVPWAFANETTAGRVHGMLIRATATAVAPLSF